MIRIALIWASLCIACGLVAHPVGVAAATAPASAPAAARPNFVVFVADDMSWDDCGPYGHPHVKTPNLDRLARDGMRFDRAFLTTSSCSPSRASILTGRYPHATGAPELHMPLPANQTLLTRPLREAGYYTAAAGKWHLGPKSTKQLDLVIEGGGPSGSDQWLKVLRERPRDKPFFLWLAAIDPHRPYKRGPGTAERRHTAADVVVPPYLPDVPEVREDLALYYDEIARLDDHVGQVLAELDAQGRTADTVVLFMADNGRPFPRCKTTLYDSGIRTPLIVRYPGHVKPGSVTTSLVSAVDLAPTVVALAGARAPDTFQGQSFVDVLTNPAASAREFAFAEHNWHDYRAFERGVRSARYTYIRNWLPELTQSPPADAVNSPTFAAMRALRDRGNLTEAQAACFAAPRATEELYDIEADPHAIRNLASDAEHAKALAQMREALNQWSSETKDVFAAERISPDRFDRETGAAIRARGK